MGFMVKKFDKEYSENLQELMIELFMDTDEVLKKFKSNLRH